MSFKEFAEIALDQENNHTGRKNKPFKKSKIFFISRNSASQYKYIKSNSYAELGMPVVSQHNMSRR